MIVNSACSRQSFLCYLPPTTAARDYGVDGFVDRLRHRKIVQWALAYLAGAFALLQAVDIVGQRFGWPEQVERVLIVALPIGFLVALVLAWYHGERGAQRVSGTELSLLALLLAIGGGILWRVAASTHAGDAAASAGSGVTALGAASTAVLPFVNMSADKANEYFSDGMTETLLNRLAQVPQLKVAARTSSFSFKGSNIDVRKIGAQLGVASLVEGSVQQAGDTLRITAQLVRAVDGAHLWSRNYDRKAADLFAIQDEIAGAVTEALVGELLPKTKEILAKGGTKDLAAYDAYTRALEKLAVNMFASNIEAEALMKQALTLDPNYVDAMLGLVNTWLNMARTGQIAETEFQTRSAPMLDRVEAIDPGNAWLLVFRGEIAELRGEHDVAERLARRAVAAAPGVARLHNILSDIYTDQENPAAAMPEMDLALALNPLDANVIRYRATKLRLFGRLDEAKAATLHAIELDPKNSSNYWELGANAYLRGNLVEAIVNAAKSSQLDRADPESSSDLAVGLAEIGESAAADAWVAEALRQAPGNLLGESANVSARFARGERTVAWEATMRLIPRIAEEHHLYWRRAVVTGCLAADSLGRMHDTRAALVNIRALPRDLGPAAFDEWVGPAASAKVKLRQLAALRRCAFTQSADETPLREQLRAIAARVEGADWESRDEWRSLAVELRNDHEAMIAAHLPPNDVAVSNLAVREGEAHMLGIGDDARLAAHFAGQRAELARQRAALPAALATEGLSLLPPAAH
jgi:TolB-like protein/Flp pilus assembly protein TadD